MTHAQQHDGHVALLAGMNGVGKPYMEVLPARALAPDVYELLGSPGLVLGCAQGDVIRRKPDGSFDVERRGPNLCVQAFRSVPFESASISELQRRFDALGGLVEALSAAAEP
jgi:hypothetical protein